MISLQAVHAFFHGKPGHHCFLYGAHSAQTWKVAIGPIIGAHENTLGVSQNTIALRQFNSVLITDVVSLPHLATGTTSE